MLMLSFSLRARFTAALPAASAAAYAATVARSPDVDVSVKVVEVNVVVSKSPIVSAPRPSNGFSACPGM